MLAFLLRRHFGVRAPPGLLADGDDDTSLTADDDTSSTPDAGRLFCASPRVAALASTRDLAESDAAHVTFEAARLALDQLQRDLRALEPQLPLRVLALHATAPGLRYASLAPPKPLAPGADDAYVEPLPVLVEFASSTKWPDDLAALHKVKSAFLLRLAACYGAAHPHALVDVASRHFGYGAADGLHTADHDCFVDIRLAPAGLTFRLRVLCEREGAMLARQAQAMEREQLAPQADALRRQLRRWTRATQWRPQHHRRILDLCQRHHPAASLTIRLLKRWLARHLLLGAVPEETAELIAARVFTEPFAGLAAPASAYAGLVRCLRLLAEWRWQHDLCVVDFTAPDSNDDDDGPRAAGPRPVWAAADGLPADVYAAMQAAFDRAPAADALRLATADDPAAERWGAVSPLLTRRLRALASAALTAIVDCVGAGNDAALPQAFTTPMADYDFILKLDKRMVCRQHEQPPASALHGPEDAAPEPNKPEVFKNLRPAAARVKLHANPFGQPRMVGFDPVALLVRDLARVYGDSALFFHDVFGGRCIAGLWNPALAKPVPFNASANANVAPCPGEKANGRPAARFNKQAVLEEMARLGEGLVVDVVVQNE
ncbi:U3 snoRNP protein [Coemansia sp. Cherry 401B]|nr:U3 snoRNP protein [Coemansia sp. Cherry 401B]